MNSISIQADSVVLTVAKSSLNEKPLLLAIAFGIIAYAILKE
ncbi:hypothetical protein ACI6PS_03465 [Flavobacterium sp. PLA-1-15]